MANRARLAFIPSIVIHSKLFVHAITSIYNNMCETKKAQLI